MSTTTENTATLVSPPSSYPSPEAEYTENLQNPQLFLEKLQKFHASVLNSTLNIPTFGGGQLDLHRLFEEVTTRGGMEKVTKDRKWKQVFYSLNCPSRKTGASFVLKKHYQSLLYHFEEVYYFRKNAPSVLATDSVRTTTSESPSENLLQESTSIHNHHSASSMVKPGSILTGTVDVKSEVGYSVTVEVGSEKWHGTLYHVPESEQDGALFGPSENDEIQAPTRLED